MYLVLSRPSRAQIEHIPKMEPVSLSEQAIGSLKAFVNKNRLQKVLHRARAEGPVAQAHSVPECPR